MAQFLDFIWRVLWSNRGLAVRFVQGAIGLCAALGIIANKDDWWAVALAVIVGAIAAFLVGCMAEPFAAYKRALVELKATPVVFKRGQLRLEVGSESTTQVNDCELRLEESINVRKEPTQFRGKLLHVYGGAEGMTSTRINPRGAVSFFLAELHGDKFMLGNVVKVPVADAPFVLRLSLSARELIQPQVVAVTLGCDDKGNLHAT